MTFKAPVLRIVGDGHLLLPVRPDAFVVRRLVGVESRTSSMGIPVRSPLMHANRRRSRELRPWRNRLGHDPSERPQRHPALFLRSMYIRLDEVRELGDGSEPDLSLLKTDEGTRGLVRQRLFDQMLDTFRGETGGLNPVEG